MNIFDNEVVLEYLEGSIIFRNIVTGEDKNEILYTELDPNGALLAVKGSVAFGPSGSWENISVVSPGTAWQLIGTGIATGDGFLAPNEFWVDPTQVLPGPTGREVLLIQDAIDLANTLFAPGISIVIRLREGQIHTWAASSIVLPTRDITITAVGQVTGEEIDPTIAGEIQLVGAGVQLGTNATATQHNFEIRDLAITGGLLVQQGWNLILREVVVAGLDVTVDQGGVGAVNPVQILLDDTSGSSDTYISGLSPITITTQNHNAPSVLPTTLRASRCELQGVSIDATPARFMTLGNTFALFDGCTFNIASQSDTDGLWIGLANPCAIEFTGTSIVGDFLGTLFARPLFSASGATPTVRFTGLSIDALDTSTGKPTPTWRWGTLTAQGYPTIGNARTPIGNILGMSMSDDTIAVSGSSGLGPVTERVMSGLGIAATGGRLIYGTCAATHPAPGTNVSPIAFQTPTSTTSAVQAEIPLVANSVYFISLLAVMRTAPAPLVGWTVATLDLVVTVDVGGNATIVSAVPGAVAGGDAMWTIDALIDVGPPDKLVPVIRGTDPAGGQVAAVDIEMRVLAVY